MCNGHAILASLATLQQSYMKHNSLAYIPLPHLTKLRTAPQLQSGRHFLLVNLSKKEINLYKGMIIGIMPYLVLGS